MHQKHSFWVAIISRIETQKIFIETGDENIDIELISSVLRSSIMCSLFTNSPTKNRIVVNFILFAICDN